MMTRKEFIKFLRSRSCYNQFMNAARVDSDIIADAKREHITDEDILDIISVYDKDGNKMISDGALCTSFVWCYAKSRSEEFWCNISDEFMSKCAEARREKTKKVRALISNL